MRRDAMDIVRAARLRLQSKGIGLEDLAAQAVGHVAERAEVQIPKALEIEASRVFWSEDAGNAVGKRNAGGPERLGCVAPGCSG